MKIKNLSLYIAALSLLVGAIATQTSQAAPNYSTQLAQQSDTREPRMRGIVKSVVGTQVLVELDRGDDPYKWVGVPQAQLGALNLMGGTPVYVQGNKIVGLAPHVASAPSSSSNFSSRVQSLWADYERSLDEPRPAENITPPSSSVPSNTSAPANSSPSEVIPSNEPLPIPGLW